MGGFGSTRWNWVSTKGTVEANLPLDINRLNRAGCLGPGYGGGWEWTRDGEQVASLRFWRDANGFVLSYRVRRQGGEWQNVEQSTRIVWVPCRFGGSRPYFVCPGIVNGIACGHRVTKLHGAGTYFLCRHCYRLAYASQREDRMTERCGGPIRFACSLAESRGLRRFSLLDLRGCITGLTSAFNSLH